MRRARPLRRAGLRTPALRPRRPHFPQHHRPSRCPRNYHFQQGPMRLWPPRPGARASQSLRGLHAAKARARLAEETIFKKRGSWIHTSAEKRGIGGPRSGARGAGIWRQGSLEPRWVARVDEMSKLEEIEVAGRMALEGRIHPPAQTISCTRDCLSASPASLVAPTRTKNSTQPDSTHPLH